MRVYRDALVMVGRVKKLADFVARYGGEEFSLILPHTSMKKAFKLVEQIRQVIEKSSFTKHRIHVTVSFGIAQSCFPGIESEMDMLDKADKALYCAKDKGRNRVELAVEVKTK